MKKFGLILKKIRESKGLSLANVAGNNISKSQLSRFENGETDITLDKLLSVLDVLNVSIREFIYMGHGFHRDGLSELIDEMRKYCNRNDSRSLKKLLIHYLENQKDTLNNKLAVILIKAKLQEIEGINHLEKEDVAFMSDYLFNVDTWGEYELKLFSNTMELFSQSSVTILTKEMVRRSDFYRSLPSHRRLISNMLLNAFSLSVKRNQIVDADYFRQQLHQLFFDETELYERLIFHFIDSCYFYRLSHNAKEILEMRKCIGLLKAVGSSDLAKRWEDYLQDILAFK
ncbi:helix-turn-helix domain-containing protein [Streptococcus sp. H31]|uniref:helix-turn-helix domain-containing protein n=1 Tax=Streptococcus huangxiaojuni TaxID=3237239 RepID=UPI0034A34097